MAGMGIGFVLSRTTGLPGLHESEWELSGVVSLALEAGFIAAAIPALLPSRPRRRALPATTRASAASPPRGPARSAAARPTSAPERPHRLTDAAAAAVVARPRSAAAAAARPVRTAPSM